MSSAEQPTSVDERPARQTSLLLEASPEGSDVQKVDLGSGQMLRFDALGPMVVNSNGVRMSLSLSLSRNVLTQ